MNVVNGTVGQIDMIATRERGEVNGNCFRSRASVCSAPTQWRH